MDAEIRTFLNDYHAATLHKMAEAAGMQVQRGGKKLRKAELVANMKAKFFTKKRVLASWAKLDQRERARIRPKSVAVITPTYPMPPVMSGARITPTRPCFKT